MRKNISKKFHVRHKNTILIPNSYVFDKSRIDGSTGKGVIFTGGIARWGLSDQLYKLEFVKAAPVTFAGRIDPILLETDSKTQENESEPLFYRATAAARTTCWLHLSVRCRPCVV